MIPRILTIAGSDSGGGAGVQADLKTITVLGGFGMSAITALTAQNTTGVRAVQEVPPEFVAAQMDAVLQDIGADAAKTGMLSSRSIVEVVADRVAHYRLAPLVVDPVMVAKGGARLLRADTVSVLRNVLLPLATVVTPNLPEAEELTGTTVADRTAMREAARRIHELGCTWVLVKGGHLPEEPVDLLYDGRDFCEVSRPRIRTTNTHGTGCTYGAAIATGLAHGMDVPAAVVWARDALQRALESSLALGSGHGPLNHAALAGPGDAG